MTPAVSFGILPRDRGTRSFVSIKQKRESQDSLVNAISNDFELRKIRGSTNLIESSPRFDKAVVLKGETQ
jgi:hypothetical protein